VTTSATPVTAGAAPVTSRWRRLGATVAAVLVAVLVLGGCGGVVGALVTTEQDIGNAGYSSVKVGLTNSDNDLSVSAKAGGAPTATDTKEIAGIVWRQFHLRFGSLTITVHGSGQSSRTVYSFDKMQATFGARDASYNKTSLRSGLIHFGIEALIGLVVVVAIIVLLIVFLVRRRRRKRRQAQAAWGPGYGYGPGSQGAGPYGAGPAPGVGSPGTGPYGAGPYGTGPYGAGPYETGPYEAGPYEAGPYEAGPYEAGPPSGVGPAPQPSSGPPPASGPPSADPRPATLPATPDGWGSPTPAAPTDPWGQPPDAGAPAPPPSGWDDPAWDTDGESRS
jgi:hypothetical protein